MRSIVLAAAALALTACTSHPAPAPSHTSSHPTPSASLAQAPKGTALICDVDNLDCPCTGPIDQGAKCYALPPGMTLPTLPPPQPEAVLGVKLTHAPTPQPKPPHHAVTKKKPAGCVVGQPCDLTHIHWTKTVGCTKVWLTNQRKLNPAAQCPPGWPYLG